MELRMIALLILLTIWTVSCNNSTQLPHNQENIQAEVKTQNIIIKSVTTLQFAKLVKSVDYCFVFITTEWCGGGKLYMNNSVLPNYNRINISVAPFYVAYLGDYDELGLVADSLKGDNPLTLYHLTDEDSGMAFFDKREMKKLLNQIDPNAEFQSVVPMRIKYKNGRAEYLKKPYSKL